MIFFAQWKGDESSAFDAINTLQNLDESKSELSQDDELIHSIVLDSAQSFCDKSFFDPSHLGCSPPQMHRVDY